MGKRASGLAQQRCNKNYVLQLVKFVLQCFE